MTCTRAVRWIWGPVVDGGLALLCGILAVTLPTALRAAVSGSVVGCEFTPYLPFVLLSAILLGWWQASAVAIASVAILGGLFLGPTNGMFGMPCFLSSAGIFLAGSAVMISVVVALRRTVAAVLSRGLDESKSGVILSLERGEVWASWHGSDPPLRLGSLSQASKTMEDFLAQVELGKQLSEQSD